MSTAPDNFIIYFPILKVVPVIVAPNLQDVSSGQGRDLHVMTESSPVCGRTGEGMLLRGVLVQIDQSEDLVHVNVEKRAELVYQILVILRIDRNVIPRVISDPAAWKALSQTTDKVGNA